MSDTKDTTANKFTNNIALCLNHWVLFELICTLVGLVYLFANSDWKGAINDSAGGPFILVAMLILVVRAGLLFRLGYSTRLPI